MFRRAGLLSGVLAAAAMAAAQPEVAALMRLDEEFCASFQEKGVAGWLAYWAEDAIVFPPRGPILRGKVEAVRYYKALFGSRPGALRWKPAGGDVSASGDLGFTFGTWVSSRPGADAKLVTTTGKYFTTWKKQRDGSWKIVADIGQPDAPEKP